MRIYLNIIRILAFLLILTGLSASLTYAQRLGFEFKKNQRRVHIPFEVYNNLIVIPVSLNHTLPLRFILDTGIRTAILTERIFGDMLNIAYTRKISIKGPGNEKQVEALIASNVTIEIPGIIGRGQAILVLEEDYLQLENYLGTKVHGILGYEIFSRFVVDINYKSKHIIIHDPARYRPKKSFREVPIVIQDTKPYLFSEVKIDSSTCLEAKLMVDTGASHAVLFELDSNKNSMPTKNVETTLGRGLGGEIRGHLARIDRLSLEDFDFDGVIASYPDQEHYLDSLVINRDGTLGGEVLNRFRVVFNYSENKMYLKKNNEFKEEFEFNMSGLEVNAFGDDLETFKIINVRKNSSGEQAGLKVGDIITRLNGIPAENLKLNIIQAYFTSKPNRKMTIKRDEKKIDVKFRLERII